MRDCLRVGVSGLLLMVVLFGCGGDAPTPTALPEYVEVPINLSGVKRLGTLYMELAYDPKVLQAVDFEPGALSGISSLEVDLETPGKVIVDLVGSGARTYPRTPQSECISC